MKDEKKERERMKGRKIGEERRKKKEKEMYVPLCSTLIFFKCGSFTSSSLSSSSFFVLFLSLYKDGMKSKMSTNLSQEKDVPRWMDGIKIK